MCFNEINQVNLPKKENFTDKNYFPDFHCPLNSYSDVVLFLSSVIKCCVSLLLAQSNFTMFFLLAVITAGKRESPCSNNHPDAKRTRTAGTVSNNCSCMECGSLLSGCDNALHERI